MGKEINPINSNATRKRQKFDKAFKLNAIKLLQAGHKPATQLALELGIRRNLLYKWAETLAAHGGDVNTAFNGPGHNKLYNKCGQSELTRFPRTHQLSTYCTSHLCMIPFFHFHWR